MIASQPSKHPLLDSLLRSGFSLPHAIIALNLSAHDLLHAADHSHPQFESISTFARQLAELHTLHLQTTALENLLRVCKESQNLVHVRLAATAILRYNPSRTTRRAPASDYRPPSPPSDRSARRSAPPNIASPQGRDDQAMASTGRMQRPGSPAPVAAPDSGPRSPHLAQKHPRPTPPHQAHPREGPTAPVGTLEPTSSPSTAAPPTVRALTPEPLPPLPFTDSPAAQLRARAGAAPLPSECRASAGTRDPLLAILAAISAPTTALARPP